MIHVLKIISIKRRLFCCLLFFMTACTNKKDNNINGSAKENLIKQELNINKDFKGISQAKQYVKQGDLILHTGRDFTSDIMRRVSKTDKTFSHCGIASYENDTLFVYHAIGGEWNPDQKLRRDPFEFFCNPYENKGFGIYRYLLNRDEQLKVFTLIRKNYNNGVMFDMRFDLETNDRMYCSEFVYKTIETATGHKIKIPVDTLNSKKFVAIDNLFINPFCKQIKRVKFQKE
jgi:Permuted papain-like amidase enzyme, YaeF/YiiX, C92 family